MSLLDNSRPKIGALTINMKQFRAKWEVVQDNVVLAENIDRCNGKFFSLDARPYMEALNDFEIFYTFREE